MKPRRDEGDGRNNGGVEQNANEGAAQIARKKPSEWKSGLASSAAFPTDSNPVSSQERSGLLARLKPTAHVGTTWKVGGRSVAYAVENDEDHEESEVAEAPPVQF